ncbi:MAG: NUDIX domain-containing protein [Thermoanaerobaculia bacterium]
MDDLIRQLRGYVPADDREAGHRDAMVRLAETAPSSFSREHFFPGHFTASAFVVDDARRLLLHHHRRLDRWLQLGGHIEEGESLLDAARREALEESGLETITPVDGRILDLDIHPIPAGRGEPPHLHFDVRFLFTTPEPESIRTSADESVELRWFDLDEASKRLGERGSERALEKIERLLGRS